ncbi:thiamine phosphate synthase [Psychromarinibacter sp. C21-152]|uniref:Thiamine phosphate synthase n=1 Tax=Psychromarinibacter sediminicola TaxID=3033385 RepID=A0AAE3T9H7_9RHOB|nr:thiamine phosphate synthase [Psychromarinibacter sediminicola]MDF0600535.1 thiamine phosphate synthase [Psychromarinibacter sediminicola]
MAETEQPQIYLITPPEIELSSFPDALGAVLDAVPVACLRLALAASDEDRLIRAGDALRGVAHDRDVPLVIDRHWQLAERLGLDGVHLPDGARQVRPARKALGQDAIVGAYCGTSRHDGMTAGEAGADYVAFGPCAPTVLGDGSYAEADLFGWWSEMIEVPVVAEGALTAERVAALAPVTDFFGIGTEIWDADDPVAALKALAAPSL